MKCIKSVNGEIRRVKDEQATAYVKAGDWKYIPKSEWKAAHVKKKAIKPVDEKKKKKKQNTTKIPNTGGSK